MDKKIFEFELRDKQSLAINEIDNNNSVITEFHTSYGKTAVAIYTAVKSKEEGFKTILATPIKALNKEHFFTFSKYGLKVAIFDSDNESDLDQIYNNNLLIFSYEKLDSVLRKAKNHFILKDVKYIIIDEVHNIITNRGASIENILILSKNINKKMYRQRIVNHQIKFLLLSATIGDDTIIRKFDDFKVIKTEDCERPVKLNYEFEKVDDNSRAYRLISILKNEPMNTLVFCKSRRETIDFCSLYIGERINIRSINIKELIKKYKTAYHHSGMSKEDRDVVESEYRAGNIDVLFSTTTLAMGVNLPAKRVIVSFTTRYSPRFGEVLVPAHEILQMAGRAGRNAKIDKEAYAVIFTKPEHYDIIKNNLEPPAIKSVVDIKHLTLLAIVSNIANNMLDFTMLKTIKNYTLKEFKDAINYLLQNKLIYIKDKNYYPTFLGRMIIYLYIDIETGIYLNKLFLPDEKRLLVKFLKILDVKEFAENVIVRSEDKIKIDLADEFFKDIGINIYLNYKEQLYKIFLLLFKDKMLAYFRNKYNDDKLKIYWSKADYYVLKKSAERILFSASVIGNQSIKDDARILLRAIEYQTFTKNTLNLARIRGIGEVRLNKLKNNGIKSINDLLNTDTDKLSRILSLNADKINNIKEQAKELIK